MYEPPTRNIDVVFPPANIWLRVSLDLAAELHRLLFQDHLVDGPPEEGGSLCRMAQRRENDHFIMSFNGLKSSQFYIYKAPIHIRIYATIFNNYENKII